MNAYYLQWISENGFGLFMAFVVVAALVVVLAMIFAEHRHDMAETEVRRQIEIARAIGRAEEIDE